MNVTKDKDSDQHVPLVSLGLPVFNGEDFVSQAIKSVLCQSFTDFELIISDNASTDRTEELCRNFARSDERITYYRHPENKGAAWNFNFTVTSARGAFFKWVAHDDLIATDYLQTCATALRNDSRLVMAFTHAENIDENGDSIGHKPDLTHAEESDPATRFRYSICIEHSCLAIFGLIRMSVLKQTPLIAPYVGSDRVLLAELALHGPFREIECTLFFHREHPNRSTRAIPLLQERTAWFDPTRKLRMTFPHWRLLKEYIRSILRAPLSTGNTLKCLAQTVRWLRWHYRDLYRDIFSGLSGVKSDR